MEIRCMCCDLDLTDSRDKYESNEADKIDNISHLLMRELLGIDKPLNVVKKSE